MQIGKYNGKMALTPDNFFKYVETPLSLQFISETGMRTYVTMENKRLILFQLVHVLRQNSITAAKSR